MNITNSTPISFLSKFVIHKKGYVFSTYINGKMEREWGIGERIPKNDIIMPLSFVNI